MTLPQLTSSTWSQSINLTQKLGVAVIPCPLSLVSCAKCDFDWYLTFMRHVRYNYILLCLLFILLVVVVVAFALVYLRTFPKTNNRHGYPHTYTHTLRSSMSSLSLDVNKQFSTFQHSLIKTEIMGRRTHTRTQGKQFTHVCGKECVCVCVLSKESASSGQFNWPKICSILLSAGRPIQLNENCSILLGAGIKFAREQSCRCGKWQQINNNKQK